MSNDDLKKRVCSIAADITQGKVGIVLGVRQLEPLLLRLNMDMDADLMIIKAVDSDSDEYPMGEVRRFWNPEKLKEIDLDREEFEKFYQKDVFNACRILIDKFK
jgi:hypothetical protein